MEKKKRRKKKKEKKREEKSHSHKMSERLGGIQWVYKLDLK